MELPRALALETPEDVAVLREVVPHMHRGNADTAEALRLWKQEKMRRTETVSSMHIMGEPVRARGPRNGRQRILYVSNGSAFSGAEQSLCELVRHVDQTRFETHAMLAHDGTFADALRGAGLSVLTREAGFGRPNFDNLAYVISAVRRIQPDLVHLNGPDAVPMTAAKLLGLPVVLHVRNGATAAYLDLIQPADVMIAVSDFLRRELLMLDAAAGKIHVVYDEVDTDVFRKGAFSREFARRELGVPADAHVVVMIARYAPNKRHDLLLAALARVREAIPSVYAIIKGDVFSQDEAELHARVRAQAESLGLLDRIKWISFLDDIRVVHEAADVLVLCSDREGLGRCVVEAMAMEVPVVVTDSGGSHELVGENERGYAVRSGDAADLSAKILAALNAEVTARQHLVREARSFAEEQLSARGSARRVMGIYDQLLASVRSVA